MLTLKQLVQSLRQKPLSGGDIERATDDEVKVLVYSDLGELDTVEQVFGDRDCVCLLYETRPHFGHWVGLVRHPEEHKIEFFDPYGYAPDEEIDFVPKKFRAESGQDFPHLTQLLVDSDYDLTYNPIEIQKHGEDISSCGRHVLLRCMMRAMPLSQYVKFIHSTDALPDDVVTALTAFV
jgi:hypothetical protein